MFLFYLPPHPGLTICPLSLGVAVSFALGQGQPSHRFNNLEETRVGNSLGVLNGCPADSYSQTPGFRFRHGFMS